MEVCKAESLSAERRNGHAETKQLSGTSGFE
jgi:hypothetical protein